MFRQRVVSALFLLVFCAVIVRLFQWQIVEGESLAQEASNQYYFKLTLPATRGSIITSDEAYLSTNKTAFLVYAEPQKIYEKHDFSQKLAPLLNLDAQSLESQLQNDYLVWYLLKHKVDGSIVNQLKELKLEGMGFEKENKRFYPEGSMSAHILGFVGSDANGNDQGYFGLEGKYNLALKGKSGQIVQEKDAVGLPILLGETKRYLAEDGQTLVLHMDRTVQYILETKLKEGIQKYGAKSGMVGVLDSRSGGILGFASFPNYDPQKFGDYDKSLYANPLISYTYEPGSTFKTLVMAAALNERFVDQNTIFNENGPVSIGEYLIRTWNNEYHGEMTATQILEKSSNPGMVFIGKKLGKDKLISYIKKYGFYEKSGIDLEGEVLPQTRVEKDWYEIDLATVTFGQGIAVTPIQMLRAVGSLANNGNLLVPHVVKKIIDPSGKKIEIPPKISASVIRPATANTITQMMISAVNNGEAKWAKPKGYRIAGKTGTAQIPVSGHYDADKTIASFVGYAPADNPKFVMLVLLNEPTTSPWGSETAAPLFMNIAKELFVYYAIAPVN